MTVISESNEHSRIAAISCVKKVVDCLEEKMAPHPLDKIYIWSDDCAAQFRSRYVFALLCHLFPSKHLEWHYNEAHHGKGPMDGIGGTLKNQVFQHVKSGKITIKSPEEFCFHANKIIPSISSMYLPLTDILKEPDNVSQAPAIHGTLKIHKVIRSFDDKGVCYLTFFLLSCDEIPSWKQYYRKENDPIVCGHSRYDGDCNNCAYCKEAYYVGSKREEWLEYPVCKQWYHGSCFGK